jgi:hypothetical protein
MAAAAAWYMQWLRRWQGQQPAPGATALSRSGVGH